MTLFKRLAVTFAALALFITMGACSRDNYLTSQPDGEQCVSVLSTGDAQKLQDYVASNGDTVKQYTDANDNDTLCVVDEGSNQHYIHRQDDSNFLLYWMMMRSMGYRSSSPLLAYGMMNVDSGNVLQTMAIMSLMGVDNNGYVYRPYSMVDSGQFIRRANYTNTQVTNVFVGQSTKPLPRAEASTKMADTYKPVGLPKATQDAQASVSKTGTTAVDTNKKATSYVADKKVDTTATVDKSRTTGSGANAGTTGTGVKSTSSTSKSSSKR